jgi:hypothetical protein
LLGEEVSASRSEQHRSEGLGGLNRRETVLQLRPADDSKMALEKGFTKVHSWRFRGEIENYKSV